MRWTLSFPAAANDSLEKGSSSPQSGLQHAKMCRILVTCCLAFNIFIIDGGQTNSIRIGFADGAVTRPISYYEHITAISERTRIRTHSNTIISQQRNHSPPPTTPTKTPKSKTIYWKHLEELNTRLYFNERGRKETARQALERRFHYVFGPRHKKKNKRRGRWIKPEPWRPSVVIARKLDQNNNNDDANDDAAAAGGNDYYQADDASNYNNDDVNNNDDINNNNDDDAASVADERCSEFLVSFLEGTTDAHDTCEGMMNAYTAADCAASDSVYNENHDYDDYFNEFAEHECCQALMAHHRDYCEDDRLLTNFHLFVAAAILLLCECAKAMVARFNVHFLPEAAVCILVGTSCGIFAHVSPFADIDDISFDDDLFLTVLLPPIIFEAALSVSKFEFKRRRGAIFMFSVFGTVISTFTAGLLVHYISKVTMAQTFPMLDSLVFGALISSIDPVAILSVLSSLNLDQKDTIFILVFGESLLNDGIAITVFQTLVDRFDGKTNDGTASADEIFDALASFLIAMFGSIFVGLACGCGAWVYFFFLGKDLPPVMEVGSFFLWALIPWYIADGLGMSGIVSIVAVGFFIDIYIAGPKETVKKGPRPQLDFSANDDYLSMQDHITHSASSFESGRSVGPLPSTERLHLSSIADRHVRFVAHLTAQLAENAIFAYLGLFLFSNNYDWDPALVTISIFSCVVSRAFMVLVVSYVVLHIYRCRGMAPGGSLSNSSKTALAISDPRTQAVLVLAGLRGAVSLALVENVPIFNQGTGEGCEFKQLMKGMTSASILFTTFVFGGGAYYILPHLGITPDRSASMDLESGDDKTDPMRPNSVKSMHAELRIPDSVVV